MSNIATTIEQSKRLFELGLSKETADMSYSEEYFGKDKDRNDEWCWKLNACKFVDVEGIIPAWSLSALLEVMPSNIGDYDLYITKHKYVDGGHGYNVEYNRGFTISVLHKGTSHDLVTAAYEMVCCLLEQGLIKKGGQDETTK